MRKRWKKSSKPIYTFAIVWLLLSLIFPLYRLSSLIIVFLISLLISKLVGLFTRKKVPVPDPEPAPPPKPEPEPEKSYGPEVDAIIAEGKRAQAEMGRLYASISNLEVKAKIAQLMQISDKIVQDAIHDPNDVPQIKKFLDYYLPTTIKLLNAYDRMGAQGVQGINISSSMRNIESMLDTAIEAYQKQLDSLFANQALDIETDIDVMNTMLAREGLTGGARTPSSYIQSNDAATGPKGGGYTSPFGTASPLEQKKQP